jgi:hypothetical protein
MPASNAHVEMSKENGHVKTPVIDSAAIAKMRTSELQNIGASGTMVGKDASAVASRNDEVSEPGENELGKNAVVVVTIEGGKKVNVVEKAAIDNVKPTENGSQKRTFSSMGGPKHDFY